MPVDTTEKQFESDIEAALTQPLKQSNGRGTKVVDSGAHPYRATDFTPGGYHARRPQDYDRARCLLPQDALDFVRATQPREWAKLERNAPDDPEGTFLTQLAKKAERKGTLWVLRNGVKVYGAHFRMAFFRPETRLNEALRRKYEANQFAVVRQLRYSERTDDELDLALFLNGLPLFTAELKNPFTRQTWEDAVHQYRHDRDVGEPLFALGRALAHFAVDPDEVHFTTHLRGEKTRFFPFNRGFDRGAGNRPSATTYPTAYLWEETWARDSVLDLVQHFIHEVDLLDDDGDPTGEKAVIFPRYHQLDAVRRLVGDARRRGPGERYLVQHSAGSGKSFTIAWLAHRLASLHDANDERVFDAVIVVTDRRVLDQQLSQTVGSIEQVRGLVESVERGGRHLREAIEGGKQIVVTTIQKFPVISESVRADAGRRYAVLVDEAHSSQSGELRRHLNAVLEAGSLEEAEERDALEGDDLEDVLQREMALRGALPNVSTFAFTATPKPKTLELFGTENERGELEPFSLYSMRQAIEEGFIEDVLQHYVTYEHHFALLKEGEQNPRFEKGPTSRVLKRYVTQHPHTIGEKVRIIATHFHAHVAHRVGGKAKAMIVTRSRLHAVRTALALRAHLHAEGLPSADDPYGVLVAFSGTVRDAEAGEEYTESSLNGFPEAQTARVFGGSAYRFLVVANKFQTGFDEPLLTAMYVDKPLRGVTAVQTLSRLNRIHPEKDGTVVLDFVNTADEIRDAFQPFYDRTVLTGRTDPHLLYDLYDDLADAGLYTEEEVRAFVEEVYREDGAQGLLHALLRPVVDRYRAADDDEQEAFRRHLAAYVRLYAFLAQVLTFSDAALEKLFTFGRLLLLKLPIERRELPLEALKLVGLDRSKLQQTWEGRVELDPEGAVVEPTQSAGGAPAPPAVEGLDAIVRALNERFGLELTDDDKVFIGRLEERLAQSNAIRDSFRVNPPDDARLTFDQVAHREVQGMIDDNFELYKRITDKPGFGPALLDWLFERYRHGEGPVAPEDNATDANATD